MQDAEQGATAIINLCVSNSTYADSEYIYIHTAEDARSMLAKISQTRTQENK